MRFVSYNSGLRSYKINEAMKIADKIILMKDGNVLKHGTHSELLKNSKEYESLYKKQMMH